MGKPWPLEVMPLKIRYLCTNPKCEAVKAGKPEVMAIKGYFIHPYLGHQEGMICPYCYKPVRIK